MSQSGSNSGGGGGSGVLQVTTDAGIAIPIAGNINLLANPNAGGSVFFIASSATIDLFTTDGNGNTFIGQDCGISATAATNSTAVGFHALGSLTSGDQNSVIGEGSAPLLVSGTGNSVLGGGCMTASNAGETGNIAIGYQSLTSGLGCNLNTSIGAGCMGGATNVTSNICIGNTTANSLTHASGRQGSSNIAIGDESITNATTANFNVLYGHNTAQNLLTGISNLVLGSGNGGTTYVVADSWTSSESSNICIQNIGVIADNNTIRIGTQGSGAGAQNSCYIAGITGVNVGSVANVVSIATGSGQLGTTAITAGIGISVTPGANVITIAATGSGAFSWSVITANQTALVNNGYFCNKAGTLALALPAASAVGDVIEVANINTATGIQFTQAASQQIFIGNTSTTLGATGTLTSIAVGDTLKIVCRTANLIWQVTSMVGNWTPA